MLTRNSRATSGDVLRRRHAIDALEGTAEARRFVEAALLCHIVDRQLGRGQQSHGFLHLNGRDERLGRFTGDLLQTTPQGSGRHVQLLCNQFYAELTGRQVVVHQRDDIDQELLV